MMRSLWVIFHRWIGLAMAVFLFVSGLTGAIISWDHELDEWLNPQLFDAQTEQAEGQQFNALALADQLEADDPKVRVSFMSLTVEPGHSLLIGVDPKPKPETGKAYELDYNQVAIDPATATVQATRMWGDISLSKENLLPFLYKLHYSMHIPDGFGIELGILLMGIIAIVWTIDSFIAVWISFPKAKSWKKSFRFRWKQGGYKLNFDLHRSGGVWLWPLLLLLAVTSVSMNLEGQVMRPLVALFSDITPSPFEQRLPTPMDEPTEPAITRQEAVLIAEKEAIERGWTDPAGGIFYADHFDIYGVGFYQPGADHGDSGLGNPWLYFDGKTGDYLGHWVPGTGSAGDIFLQAQFPLHSGRILGLPGRIIISLMGLMVAMLSVTGIIIWAKKRRARVFANSSQKLKLANEAI